MNKQIVVCTVASNDYLIYLERLLASVRINLSNVLFFVVLVNVDELKVPYLKKLYNNIEVSLEYIKFDNVEEQRGYCTNRRAKLFPQLMSIYECPIVWVDVDSLFVRPAEELINYSYKYDLSVQYSSDHPVLKADLKKLRKLKKGPLGTPYGGVFSNGIITTNNSAIAKEYFKEFMSKVNMNPYMWNTDQEAMYLTYKEFEGNIKFRALDYCFHSRKNEKDTIIWTVKGNIKTDEEYILRGEEYIHSVLKWPITHILEARKKNLNKEEIEGNMIKIKIKKAIKKILNIVCKYAAL